MESEARVFSKRNWNCKESLHYYQWFSCERRPTM